MPAKEKTPEKRLLILSATTALLQQKGVQALTFEGIAAQSGLSRQLVRYYFPDLETLMVALCDHLGAAYRDIVIEGVVEVAQINRLDFFLDFFFGLLDDRPMPNNLEVYDVFFAQAINSAAMRNSLCDKYKTLGDVITHELSISFPEFKGAASEELSFSFVSMMHAHWSFVATLRYSDQHNHLIRKAFARLIASYRGDPDATKGLDQAWMRKA